MLADIQKQIVDRLLGSFEKRNTEYLYNCPQCLSNKKKLSFSFIKNKYKCWVCLYSGSDINSFIKEHGTYEDLKRCIAYTDHTSLESIQKLLFTKEEKESAINKSCFLPKEYKFIFYSNSDIAKKALDYLYNVRKITETDIYLWRIGICETGDLRDRIIIPSFNEEGYCNYYVAQRFDDGPYKWLYPRDIMKYNIIFNEYNIDWSQDIYITEGIFDAIKIKNNVIPLIGKTIVKKDNIYSKLLEKIIVYKPRIYLCLDTDNVKGRMINRSFGIANELLHYGLEDIWIMDPYPYKDFGDIPSEYLEEFKNIAYKIESSVDIIEHELMLLSGV